MKTIKDLSDEQFCLSYELHILSTRINLGKQERWLPGFTDVITDFDHQQRYDWACDFVKNKTVLDIACGCGKGSFILADKGEAKSVLGCDIEEEAVRYSSIKYKKSNLSYEVQNAVQFNSKELFDVIISFETIEHISETDLFLNSIYDHLNDNGIFIVSTPIAAIEEDLKPKNIYHVIEWGFKKFQEVVSKKFIVERIFVQLHDEKPYTFLEYQLNKFFPKKTNYKNTKIEEYSSSMAINKFGKQINGYQILICKKNNNQ